jgi:hypothetical protein
LGMWIRREGDSTLRRPPLLRLGTEKPRAVVAASIVVRLGTKKLRAAATSIVEARDREAEGSGGDREDEVEAEYVIGGGVQDEVAA